jgi:hypothetical protein
MKHGRWCDMADNLPKDYEEMAAWFPVIRRAIRDMVVGNSQLVTLTVICDEKRKPLWWGEPVITQLEPRARKMQAKEM